MSTFAENLRLLRKSRGYSQDKFARLIGSNQVTLSSWEVGSRIPSLSTIQGIADVFHVPLSSLISIQDSGLDDDLVREVADLVKAKPKIKELLEKIKYLSDEDLEVVFIVASALTKDAYVE